MLLVFSRQACPTLRDPVGCSTPGFPVRRRLLELAQTRVCQVGLLALLMGQHRGASVSQRPRCSRCDCLESVSGLLLCLWQSGGTAPGASCPGPGGGPPVLMGAGMSGPGWEAQLLRQTPAWQDGTAGPAQPCLPPGRCRAPWVLVASDRCVRTCASFPQQNFWTVCAPCGSQVFLFTCTRGGYFKL